MESEPARCYLPNAVTGSWLLMSLLAPVLLLAGVAAVFYVGLLFRAHEIRAPSRQRGGRGLA